MTRRCLSFCGRCTGAEIDNGGANVLDGMGMEVRILAQFSPGLVGGENQERGPSCHPHFRKLACFYSLLLGLGGLEEIKKRLDQAVLLVNSLSFKV
jgi:hypothetical protein